MIRLKLILGSVVLMMMACTSGFAQQSGGTNPSTIPAATANTTSPNPLATNGGTGTSNAVQPKVTSSPNTDSSIATGAPPTAGSTPLSGAQPGQTGTLSGAQPGQTGTMESQRLNSLNQVYENQQRATIQQQQQSRRNQSARDINQLSPGTSVVEPAAIRGGVNRPVDPHLDREFIVGDLRRQGQPADGWRVVNQQGRWWYWGPDNSWLYYDSGNWTPYHGSQNNGDPQADRRSVNFPPGYAAEDWRLVHHNNRWWFWTPNESWMYFQNNQWNDYRAAGQARAIGQTERSEQYGVGYRGDEVVNGVMSAELSTDANPAQSVVPQSIDATN